MSRRVGYDFAPTPRKWHPAWADATMAMRGLRASLFELNDGGPIAIEGDWLTSLCKQMHVGGRERPNVRKALLDLQARGVLGVDGQMVSICFRPDSQLHRPVVDPSSTCADLSSIGRGSDIPIESTPRNDTTHVRQTDKTDKKEETRERARARESSARFEKPPTPPSPPELPPAEQEREPWLRVWELYAEHIGLDVFQLAGAGTQERALRAIADSSAVESGHTHGSPWEAAVKRLLRAWSADKWVQEKRPSIANLALNLHRYAAPKQKPIVKLAPQPADSLMEHWSRIDAMRREEQRREDELNEIRCREALAEYEALDRAGGES